jgi:hypothetical protein
MVPPGRPNVKRSTQMFPSIVANWPAVTWSASILIGSVLLSLILRSIILLLLKRIASRHQTVTVASLRHGERLSRWIFPLLALLAAVPASSLPDRVNQPLEPALGIGLIVAVAWLVILASDVIADVIIARYRMDVAIPTLPGTCAATFAKS